MGCLLGCISACSNNQPSGQATPQANAIACNQGIDCVPEPGRWWRYPDSQRKPLATIATNGTVAPQTEPALTLGILLGCSRNGTLDLCFESHPPGETTDDADSGVPAIGLVQEHAAAE